MNTTNSILSSCISSGYICFPRKLIIQLLNDINDYDVTSLYFYMLVNANYSSTSSSNGFIVERGELGMSSSEVMEHTKITRSTGYRMLKKLEKEQLIISISKNHHQYFRLPKYEEHCGRQISHEIQLETNRHQESITGTEEEKRTFEKFFGYYHYLLETTPRDKAKAYREWQNLSPEEREEACNNLEIFSQACKGQKHKKLACNYLKEKSYKI